MSTRPQGSSPESAHRWSRPANSSPLRDRVAGVPLQVAHYAVASIVRGARAGPCASVHHLTLPASGEREPGLATKHPSVLGEARIR